MCGIVGSFAYLDSAAGVDRRTLESMRDKMIHRGPDAEGVWVSEDGRVGLAHRRLSILDLRESANQPMSTVGGELQIVFNGEIYNYQALRKDLELGGYSFKTNGDTEVLLALYLKKGASMLEDLRGMFAFAIWDTRSRVLFMARDHFGIKPLYYSISNGMLHFASEVKALRIAPGVDTEIEPAGAVGFFLLGFIPDPFTSFKGIRQLAAGATLTLKAGGEPVENKYFSVTESWCDVNARLVTRSEIQEELKTTLLDSVEHHLIADVPTGFFLSAGLDSTTIAALATETNQAELNSVTLGFESYAGGGADEAPLAEEVAKYLNLSHQTKWIKRDDFLNVVDPFFEVMDQPTIDGLNVYLVSKVTAETGLKVALSGLGGDELFCGYPSFSHVPQMAKVASYCPSPVIGRMFRLVAEPVIKHFTSPKFAGLFEFGGTFSGSYLLRRGLFMPWELPTVLDPDIVRAGWKVLKPLLTSDSALAGIESDHRRVSSLEMNWYMKDQLLRVNDWAGMAHSLEIRVPFVDREVLKCVAALSHKDHPLKKRAMTTQLKRPLPHSILERQKSPFAVPLKSWLASSFPELKSKRHGLRAWGRKVWDGYIQE